MHGPEVIFVSHHTNWGTAIARGHQISDAWRQRRTRVISCDPRGDQRRIGRELCQMSAKRFDQPDAIEACRNSSSTRLTVHIKYVCRPALQLLAGAAHVLDPLDQLYSIDRQSTRAFRGILAHSEAHARFLRSKVAPPVFVVPHHALPGCPQAQMSNGLGRAHAQMSILIVGLDAPSAPLRSGLERWSAMRGGTPVRVLYEYDLRLAELRATDAKVGPAQLRVGTDVTGKTWVRSLCEMLHGVRAAVAWDQLSGTTWLSNCMRTHRLSDAHDCFAIKPGERLLNPLAEGVPTIGYAGYPAFRELLGQPVGTAVTPRVQDAGDVRSAEWLLASDLNELTSRLDVLLRNRSAWRRARELGLQATGAFTVSRVLPRYEKLLELASG